MAAESKRGGARPGAGRKSGDGAIGLVAYPIKLTTEQKASAIENGGAPYIRALIDADIAKRQLASSDTAGLDQQSVSPCRRP